tara:strand:- start:391 stop:852 length:462 start_codon:yes stop_codon:yes gene_type:complete
MALSVDLMANEIEENILNGATDGKLITSQEWTNVLQSYFGEAKYPPAGGLGLQTALDGFQETLGDFNNIKAITFKLAFFTFGSTLALSAIGSAGIPATPPIGLPLIETVFPAGLANQDKPNISKLLGTVLHSYFKTQIYFTGTPTTPKPNLFS